MATELELALAFELGTHVDDIVDSDNGLLETDSGKLVGNIEDTEIVSGLEASSFAVKMADGRTAVVSVREVPL